MTKKLWLLDASDHTPDDLRAIFRPYQIQALTVLWAHPEGSISREVWESVNKVLSPATISRASIINFLDKLVEAEILSYETQTCKGGHRRVYTPAMKWNELEDMIVWRFIEKLMLIFPRNKIHALEELRVPA